MGGSDASTNQQLNEPSSQISEICKLLNSVHMQSYSMMKVL